MEIISPRRTSLQDTVVCDCCRRLKLASEFDQDCCGICADCLDADPVLFDLDATSEQEGGKLQMAFMERGALDELVISAKAIEKGCVRLHYRM